MVSKEYQAKYHREVWYPKNREKRKQMVIMNKRRIAKLISDYKIGIGCIECGYKAHPEALDFDHIGEKSFSISSCANMGYSWEKIKKEIDKCEIVCANCHRVRTSNRRKPC